MDKSSPLLSICIPTYNRCISLNYCLEKLLISCKDYEDFVEIIVSDNASDDGTEKIVEELIIQNKILRYFRNEKNEGFNSNIFLLTDKYSKGKYCWLIGDDDFVDQEAVRIILSVLKENLGIGFVGLNFRLEPFGSQTRKTSESVEPIIFKSDFPSVVNKMSRSGNLFITFISASIFLREKFVNFPKHAFSKDPWHDYLSTFPHSYIQLTLFKDSEAIYIENELLTATIHEKNWHKMNPAIYLYAIPSLYKHSLRIGFGKEQMNDSYALIMSHAIRQLPKRINYTHVHLMYKLRFIINELKDFRFYKCGFNIIKEKLSF